MSYRDNSPSETDQHILATARRLLNANPAASFTMDQLAAESGISRATIYRRFGSRTALLQALATQDGLNIDELGAPDIRERILEATRVALSQAGSVNFTIEQVAAAANVGVATIYRHFGNKDNLLKALSDQFHPRRAALQMLAQASGDLASDLQIFAGNALRFMYENRDMATFYFSSDVRVQDIFKILRGDQNRTLDSLSQYLEAQIQAGQLPTQNAFDLAAAFVGMLVGFAFIRASYTDEPLSPEQAAQTIVQIFLSGIQTEENA